MPRPANFSIFASSGTSFDSILRAFTAIGVEQYRIAEFAPTFLGGSRLVAHG
jgi:hypothetical protein